MKKYEIETENLIYQKRNFWGQYFSRAFILFCGIIAVFIILFSFVYENAPVYGVSMQPNLNHLGADKSDQVYINKFSKYGYGDIVVLAKSSGIDSNHIIKRVVGLPGDVIEIKQDSEGIFLYRNDERIVEDYIFNISTGGDPNNIGMYATLENYLDFKVKVKNNPDNYSVVFDTKGRLVLQKDQIFVLGDNRGYSLDSSFYGPFTNDSVVGKVDFIIPYGTAPLYYFLKYYTGIDLTFLK